MCLSLVNTFSPAKNVTAKVVRLHCDLVITDKDECYFLYYLLFLKNMVSCPLMFVGQHLLQCTKLVDW